MGAKLNVVAASYRSWRYGIMRAAVATLLLTLVTACANHDPYGGQWRDGPWQQPKLIGCSAEVIVRAPTALLIGGSNEWQLEASTNNCPMGVLSVRRKMAEYLPYVSPATRRELEALIALTRREATAVARSSGRDTGVQDYCFDLPIELTPNHVHPETGTLVAFGMRPPQRGGHYEFDDNPVERYGLVSFGRELVRTGRIDRATGQQQRRPVEYTLWRLDNPKGNGFWFFCGTSPYGPLGTCDAMKDHSRSTLIKYSFCVAMLPHWRMTDRVVGMIVDDWIVSERVVKYVKKPRAT